MSGQLPFFTGDVTAEKMNRLMEYLDRYFRACTENNYTLKNHDLLSGPHDDADPAAVVRGDVIRGNSTPEWERVAIGTAGYVWTSDGTDCAWALHGSSGLTKEAGENISALMIVFVHTDGKAYIADNTNIAHRNAIVGMATTSATTGNDVDILVMGEYTDVSWSWTPTNPLFLGTSGAITATAPTLAGGAAFLQEVAHAITATTIEFHLQPSVAF